MKKILILLLFPTAVWAQQPFYKPVMCADTKTVIEALTGKEYEEKPIWLGLDEKGHNYTVFVNAKTKGWTIIEFKGSTACILGAGSESIITKEIAKDS